MVRREPKVLQRLEATSPSLLVISTVTLMELEYGLQRQPQRRSDIEAVLLPFLQDINIVPYNLEDARATAAVRAALAGSGQPVGPYDVMLAGVGLARGLTIVSGNLREFGRVAGLLAEDWRA